MNAIFLIKEIVARCKKTSRQTHEILFAETMANNRNQLRLTYTHKNTTTQQVNTRDREKKYEIEFAQFLSSYSSQFVFEFVRSI